MGETGPTKTLIEKPLSNPNLDPVKDAHHRILTLESLIIAGLPPRGLGRMGVPDPFVHITYSENEHFNYSSNFLPDNLNPTFTLSVSFVVNDPNKGTIHCDIKDHDDISSRPIAKMTFEVKDVLEQVTRDPKNYAVLKGTCEHPDEHPEGHPRATYNSEWRIEQWQKCYDSDDDGKVIPLDQWTTLVVQAVKKQLSVNKNPFCAEMMPIPHIPPGPVKLVSLPGQGLSYVTVAHCDPDLDMPPGSGFILKCINSLPHDGISSEYTSRGQGNAFAKKLLPPSADPPEGFWDDDITSDKSLQRFCFVALGCHFMSRTEDGGFVCDTSFLERYPTRNKYCRYGGLAYFDCAGKPMKIECNQGEVFTPDMGMDWEWAKLCIRTAIFILGSGLHLMQGHFHWANDPNLAMRTHLGIHHPVRRLLAPHFFRSALVLTKSLNSLTPAKGMFDRAVMFELSALQRMLGDTYESFSFSVFVEDLQKRGMDKAPEGLNYVWDDASRYSKVCLEYVSDYLDLYYKKEQFYEQKFQDDELSCFWGMLGDRMNGIPVLTLESLKQVCGEIIVRCTGWHQHVGNVQAWLNDSAAINCRLQKGKFLNPSESHLITALIGIMTSERMPTMLQKWTQFFLDKEAKRVFEAFHQKLRVLSAEIQKRNRESGLFKLSDFDPEHVALSVSS